MKLEYDGTLELTKVNFEHIQGRIENAEMTLQEAFEQELEENNILIKDVYAIQTSLGIDKKYIELYCRITCGEVQIGKRQRGDVYSRF